MDLNESIKKIKPPFELVEIPDLIPDVTGISYNSSKIKPGEIFVAIKGYETNGHKYIMDACKKGASLIVCEEKNMETSTPQLVVSNSRRALSFFSSLFYKDPSNDINLIGVTGTNGKSTTCSIIENLLEESGRRPGVIGTIDCHYKLGSGKVKTHETNTTTPESKDLHQLILEMKESGVTDVVMEVSSHAIYLERVADLKFNTMVFTNLTQDHLDFHKSMDEYIKVKSDFIINRALGLDGFTPCSAIINIDDESGIKIAEKLKGNSRLMTYSLDKNADLFIKDKQTLLNETSAIVEFKGDSYDLKSQFTGKFNLQNTMAACGAVIESGFSPDEVFQFISRSKSVPGRMEQVKNNHRPNIFVDYAHTPDALENILKTFRPLCKERLICIFGCGGDRDNAKRPIMGEIAGKYCDITIITSDNPRTEDPEKIIEHIEAGITNSASKLDIKNIEISNQTGYLIEKDRLKAIKKGIQISKYEDCIVIAGKGHEDYQIIGKTKTSFDDRIIALQEVENIYGS